MQLRKRWKKQKSADGWPLFPATIPLQWRRCRSESDNSRKPILTPYGGLIRTASILNWRTRDRKWPSIYAGLRPLLWWQKATAVRLGATADHRLGPYRQGLWVSSGRGLPARAGTFYPPL